VQLLVVRHGIAEDREIFARTGADDDRRPLTEEGRKKMSRAARGLRSLVPALDLVAASPLLRAQQTAQIVAAAYGLGVGETTAVLEPDARPEAFLKWLEPHMGKKTVAIVGHEPHLSCLVTWLATGVDDSRVVLKKGAAALLEFPARPTRGGAVLLWLHAPATLRELGRSPA
jgi:phosphohistidine phosphatase